MSKAPLVKIRAATASEVCAYFRVSSQAKALLRDGMQPREFLDALIENKQFVAGIDFIAHSLLPREAIWWGCLCFQHACGENLQEPDRSACRAAVQWVLQPSEDNRAAAKFPAEKAGPASPAGALAAAANQTGGSIAPPNAPPVAPSPFAPAKAVATAVKLASTKCDPTKLLATQKSYLELGIEVAEGRFI